MKLKRDWLKTASTTDLQRGLIKELDCGSGLESFYDKLDVSVDVDHGSLTAVGPENVVPKLQPMPAQTCLQNPFHSEWYIDSIIKRRENFYRIRLELDAMFSRKSLNNDSTLAESIGTQERDTSINTHAVNVTANAEVSTAHSGISSTLQTIDSNCPSDDTTNTTLSRRQSFNTAVQKDGFLKSASQIMRPRYSLLTSSLLPTTPNVNSKNTSEYQNLNALRLEAAGRHTQTSYEIVEGVDWDDEEEEGNNADSQDVAGRSGIVDFEGAMEPNQPEGVQSLSNTFMRLLKTSHFAYQSYSKVIILLSCWPFFSMMTCSCNDNLGRVAGNRIYAREIRRWPRSHHSRKV